MVSPKETPCFSSQLGTLMETDVVTIRQLKTTHISTGQLPTITSTQAQLTQVTTWLFSSSPCASSLAPLLILPNQCNAFNQRSSTQTPQASLRTAHTIQWQTLLAMALHSDTVLSSVSTLRRVTPLLYIVLDKYCVPDPTALKDVAIA
jgi:hypothetical protein